MTRQDIGSSLQEGSRTHRDYRKPPSGRKCGGAVGGPCRRQTPAIARRRKPNSLEQSRRLQSLLEDLERPDLTGERLRAMRSVEVLELIGTAEARGVLEELAKGLTAVRLTREAASGVAALTVPGKASAAGASAKRGTSVHWGLFLPSF